MPKPWWKADEFWIKGEACRNEPDRPNIEKIVAEAENRSKRYTISLRGARIALLALAREETISPEDRVLAIEELSRRISPDMPEVCRKN